MKGWGGVEVGSIEAFQGCEKRVVIMSTIQSEQSGFVGDAKVCFFQNSSTT
jgi:superfamily I DNA and/or RNA helicase